MLTINKSFTLALLCTILFKGAIMAEKVGLDYLPPDNTPRIINGTIANWEDARHQVSIRRRYSDDIFFGSGHACGGSLIAANVVLTAMHCLTDQITGVLKPLDQFIVVAGTFNRFERTNETLIFDIANAEFVLDRLNVSTFEHDIAIVYLNTSVPSYYKKVKPIVFDRTLVPDGTICQVTGWGITEDGLLADKLRTVDVPIINREACANESDFKQGTIKNGMMCAGYIKEGEKDACAGDSGGPLVCNGTLAGIVSTGAGCALPKLPGIYVDVAYYSDWILGRLFENGIDLPNGEISAATISNSMSSYFLLFMTIFTALSAGHFFI